MLKFNGQVAPATDLERATAWLRSSGRGGKAPRQPGNAIPPSDEARALHEWLRMDRNADVQLERWPRGRRVGGRGARRQGDPDAVDDGVVQSRA